MAISKLNGLALLLLLAVASGATQAIAGSGWRGTILCTTKTASGNRSLGVDDQGRLAEMTLRPAIPAGQRVEIEGGSPSPRVHSVYPLGAVRILGWARAPLIVRTRLIENGYAQYSFYRNGRPWLGCRVAFDDAAAVSVAKFILSGRPATLTLTLRGGRLVHLSPRQDPLTEPAQAAKAKTDLAKFLALIAHGKSVAACATLARDALLIHGGRDGCIMDFESATFIYRDRYAHAAVERVQLFNLDRDHLALATINRGHSRVRALLIYERGSYRYLGDLELSRIELW